MSQSQVLQPEVTIALANADQSIANADQKVLIVGQQGATATATSGALVLGSSNGNFLGGEEDALFDKNSQVAQSIKAFRKLNKQVVVDVIPLDDNGTTDRTITFTVAGSPSVTGGTLTVVAGSEIDHKYEIAIGATDTATDIADAVSAAITADTDCPFTCTNVAGLVTLLAVNAGTVANTLGVEAYYNTTAIDDGMTFGTDLTETVTGATDPATANILDVATSRYQGIVWPFAAQTEPARFLALRNNPTNAILDGVSFTSVVEADASAAAATANALNDQNLVIFFDQFEDDITVNTAQYLGPAQNEASYKKAAQFAAIRSLRLTEDASIAGITTSSASLDQFGGTALASLPYFNTPMKNLPIIPQGRGFTQAEIETIFDAGGSVLGNNRTGTNALAGEVVTTFKTDAAGNDDITFKFLNYVDTTSNAREYFFNNYKARFAQSRLTEGAVSRGRDMANATIIRAYTEQLYQDLAGPDFVLVQDGEDAIEFFKNNLTVTLDLANGKVTITAFLPIVTQLRQIIATLKIAFSVEG
jgi:phage tail sheath gpL-like